GELDQTDDDAVAEVRGVERHGILGRGAVVETGGDLEESGRPLLGDRHPVAEGRAVDGAGQLVVPEELQLLQPLAGRGAHLRFHLHGPHAAAARRLHDADLETLVGIVEAYSVSGDLLTRGVVGEALQDLRPDAAAEIHLGLAGHHGATRGRAVAEAQIDPGNSLAIAVDPHLHLVDEGIAGRRYQPDAGPA